MYRIIREKYSANGSSLEVEFDDLNEMKAVLGQISKMTSNQKNIMGFKFLLQSFKKSVDIKNTDGNR
jgi:hypothetical protein